MNAQAEIISEFPWINMELFQRIVNKQHPNIQTCEVVDFTVNRVGGGHFGGNVFRAKVNYKIDENVPKVLSMIIKAPLKPEIINKLMYNEGIFERETQMYEELLPDAEKLLIEFNDNTELAPKCYEANKDVPYLVLEDLKARNYEDTRCTDGFDFEHFKLGLFKLAKWHASLAVLFTKGLNIPYYEKHPMEITPVWTEAIMNGIRATARAAKTYPEIAYTSEKLDKLQQTIVEKIRSLILPNDHSFFGICHGDFGSHNMMFKYNDNGQPIDAILIDFQTGYIGPPIVDVSHFILGSTSESLKDREWDLLIQYYQKILSETLSELNYNSKLIPSLTHVHIEFLEKAICTLPMVLLQGCGGHPTVDVPLKDGESPEGEEFMYNVYTAIGARSGFVSHLDYYDRKGILD